MGYKLKAGCILSVSCCQHSLKKDFKNQIVPGISKYRSFKERLLYMAADSMRAQLLEMKGYKVDIFDFTSSRYTDKNIMIRARSCGKSASTDLLGSYLTLRMGFHIIPELEKLLDFLPEKGFRKKMAS